MSPLLLAVTMSASDVLWTILIAVVATLVATLTIQDMWRTYRRVNPVTSATPTDFSGATLRPQIVVNIPPDLKAIAPLPGDTSVEGQRAVLFYSVFREALDSLQGSSYSNVNTEDVETATTAAQTAVETCYKNGQ